MEKKTYISLFSSAGVGCYGFKLNGFECIATNEIIERRLNIQKYNHKCKYESGYICGDITLNETQKHLFNEIDLWKKKEKIKEVDVIIATPPCQGMSVANLKKNEHDIVRNSLVVESIKIIKMVKPKFFIFENVPAFMKTICTDIDGNEKKISDAIKNNLSENYEFTYKIINFKNYGACSSRTRTIVIGVRKDLSTYISPLELFPSMVEEKTLRTVIGDLPSLNIMGEISKEDIYHAFRTYPENMRSWICDLKEGESAFDNKDDLKKPHQIIDGKIVINQKKNADKYTRQYWDKVGPCVHTRNDQLASQNTIHPKDDRVFSIRELMLMMTVPYEFKWSEYDLAYLNALPLVEKKMYLKKEEIKIRQSLGEAVPTIIFKDIAKKISDSLDVKNISYSDILKIVDEKKLSNSDNLIAYVKENTDKLSFNTLCKIAEMANSKRVEEAAYFTDKSIISEIVDNLPDIQKDEIRIIEPSCGVGNFVSFILKKYEDKKIILDLVDIDLTSLTIAKILIEKLCISKNVTINFIHDDFLTHSFKYKYDLVIGNPPFYKMKSKNPNLKIYRKDCVNKNTNNICSFFLDKALKIGDYVAFVFPKFLLNTPEFDDSRKYLCHKAIKSIIDFGEHGFKGVLIETIAIMIDSLSKPTNTYVKNYCNGNELYQKQNYICDEIFPYWIIYRNEKFDEIFKKMEFDCFTVFRDRQITNKYLNSNRGVRVIKSRNISMDGNEILSIPNYDSYIEESSLNGMSVAKYLNETNCYLVPNMTYYPRMIVKPNGVVVNGSVAILIPKYNRVLSENQIKYFASEEFRYFYSIARNMQTRSLNIDSTSVQFFGLLKD